MYTNLRKVEQASCLGLGALTYIGHVPVLYLLDVHVSTYWVVLLSSDVDSLAGLRSCAYSCRFTFLCLQ